jgi:Tfp pilus assembly protein PilO
MALTRRERIIMLLSIVAVFLLAADRYILSPVLEKYSQTQQTKEQLKAQLEQSTSAIKRKEILQQKWEQMKQAGLGGDFAAVESNVLRYIKDSSLKHNLVLSSVQPERIENDSDIREIEFIVSGTGSMYAVTHFLWDMETASLPLKAKTFQLGANDENADQMSLQIKLSSIYVAPKSGQKDEEQL